MAKKINEEIYFYGGLDTDSDEKFVKQGDYVDAQNIIKVENESGGIVVQMKGTTVAYSYNPSSFSSYLCGWTFYDKNETLIFFIYNRNKVSGDILSLITEFNPMTGTSNNLVSDGADILNFQDPTVNDYFIKADVLGEVLAWTDNVQMPRMINIEDVREDSSIFNEAYVDLCKIPPVNVPSCVLGIDDSVVYNNIVEAYQFKYRYVYSDYRYSVFSEASDLIINPVLVRQDNYHSAYNSYNFIYIKFNSGDKNVRYIDIAVRNGNQGAWGRISRIDKDSLEPENVYSESGGTYTLVSTALNDNAIYYYKFYNNESRYGLGDEAIRQYDNVPDRSETLSFSGDNTLILGGNTLGKDLIDIDVTLSVQYNNPGFFEGWNIVNEGVTNVSWDFGVIRVYFDADDFTGAGGRDMWFPGDYVMFDWHVVISSDTDEDPPVSTTINLQTEQTVFIDRIISSMDEFLEYIATNASVCEATPTEYITTRDVTYDTNNNQVIFTVAYEGVIIDSVSSVSVDDSIIRNTGYDYYTSYGYVNDLRFKRGASHKLGLIYQDKYGRKYPVITSNDTTINIDTIASSGSNGGASIVYSINNSPPSDATTYRWAYVMKPNIFVQTVISDVSYFQDDEGVNDGYRIALDVSGHGAYTYFGYNFEKGDIIRTLREGGYAYDTWGDYTDDIPSFRVEDVRGSIVNTSGTTISGKWLIVTPSISLEGYRHSDVSTETSSGFLNSVIEVYKVNEEAQDNFYYEIGGGGYINSSDEHIDWYTGTTTGYINSGDVWLRPVKRYRKKDASTFDQQTLYVEDMRPYDNASVQLGVGDVNNEYIDSRSKYDNTLLYSRKFFQDTKVNGLSTFDFKSKKEISDFYGNIIGLEELGDVLVIICEEKVLTAYVGATEYKDASGQTQVMKSDDPIGYVRPHAEKYGTFMKESIINTGKYVYFFDLFNGCVVRKAYNGLYPISGVVNMEGGAYNYKMYHYFKQLSGSLIDSLYDEGSALYETVKCYMGYDPYYENIYITFLDNVNSNNNIAWVFHEPSNRWVCRTTSYESGTSARNYMFTKHKLFQFFYDRIYELNNDDADRLEIFGVGQDAYVQFSTHELPNIVKLFNSMGIHADSQWTVESIEIEPTSNYPNGMYSEILDSDFVEEEGVYRAYMPRNMKTRTSTANNYDRINGDELRGYVMKIKLSTENTDKTELFKVDINSELSS